MCSSEYAKEDFAVWTLERVRHRIANINWNSYWIDIFIQMKRLNYRVIFLAHVHWHDTLQLVDICDCCHPMAWHVIFAPACERTPITPATAPFNYRMTLVFGPRKFPLSVNVRFCNKTEFDMKYKSESIQIMANESSSLVLCGVRCSICEFCPLHNDAVI